MQPLERAHFLTTVTGNSTEQPIFRGAKERRACRLMASRLPEPLIHERRRMAQKNAKKKGSPSSQTHLELLAWHLCITTVPQRVGKTETRGKVSPMRWQVERILKSWKSDLH